LNIINGRVCLNDQTPLGQKENFLIQEACFFYRFGPESLVQGANPLKIKPVIEHIEKPDQFLNTIP